ncbi:MAG: hypothetical protein R2788_13970 [Saprospiraceae bacterium]
MKNIQFLTFTLALPPSLSLCPALGAPFWGDGDGDPCFRPHFPTALNEFPETPGHDAGDQLEKYLDTQWDKERERMDYFIQEHTPKAFKDVPLKKEIGYGHRVEEICRMHESFPYDLVVMGMNSP